MVEPKDMTSKPPENPIPTFCCLKCHHWQIRLADPTNIQGDCHRYPPLAQLLAGPQGPITATYWPGPKPHTVCGEFKLRLHVPTS